MKKFAIYQRKHFYYIQNIETGYHKLFTSRSSLINPPERSKTVYEQNRLFHRDFVAMGAKKLAEYQGNLTQKKLENLLPELFV